MDKYTWLMRMYKRDVLEVHNLFHQELSGKRKVCAKQAEKKTTKKFPNFLKKFLKSHVESTKLLYFDKMRRYILHKGLK